MNDTLSTGAGAQEGIVSSGGKSSSVGLIVGVVVALVVVLAVAGAVAAFFLLRKRRQNALRKSKREMTSVTSVTSDVE